MTIYGTPGGTPANTPPFQGTTPGNPVGVLQATVLNPGVGMFPPNANNASGDSLLAATSRGAVPLNIQGSGYGVTMQMGTGVGAGGRTILDALSSGERNGTGIQTGIADLMNSDSNGSGSIGAGGANQTEGPTSGTASQASTQQPVNTLTLQGGATPIYGG